MLFAFLQKKKKKIADVINLQYIYVLVKNILKYSEIVVTGGNSMVPAVLDIEGHSNTLPSCLVRNSVN